MTDDERLAEIRAGMKTGDIVWLLAKIDEANAKVDESERARNDWAAKATEELERADRAEAALAEVTAAGERWAADATTYAMSAATAEASLAEANETIRKLLPDACAGFEVTESYVELLLRANDAVWKLAHFEEGCSDAGRLAVLKRDRARIAELEASLAEEQHLRAIANANYSVMAKERGDAVAALAEDRAKLDVAEDKVRQWSAAAANYAAAKLDVERERDEERAKREAAERVLSDTATEERKRRRNPPHCPCAQCQEIRARRSAEELTEPDPRCPHARLITSEVFGFRPRRGCLDCDAWLDPVVAERHRRT